VDFIPHEVLKEAWRSARHGEAYIVDVQAIRKPHVIGYVTKYLTKSLTRGEKGVRSEEREKMVVGLDENGTVTEERHTYTVELTSKARRIRYSRHFFPEKVSELRARLFAEIEQQSMEQNESTCSACDSTLEQEISNEGTSASEANEEDDTTSAEAESQPVKRSSWTLVEREEFTSDLKEYQRRCRVALMEALVDLRDGRNLSRRVISIWAYQRREARWAG
jgi:hypothetical protein